jgi:hypothetical protein
MASTLASASGGAASPESYTVKLSLGFILGPGSAPTPPNEPRGGQARLSLDLIAKELECNQHINGMNVQSMLPNWHATLETFKSKMLEMHTMLTEEQHHFSMLKSENMRLSRIIEQLSVHASVHASAAETPRKRHAFAEDVHVDNVRPSELLRRNKIHKKLDAVFVTAPDGPEKKDMELFDESTAMAKIMCVTPMFGIMSWSFLNVETKETFWQLLMHEEFFNRQYEKRNADAKGACWEMLRSLRYCEVCGRDTYQERLGLL